MTASFRADLAAANSRTKLFLVAVAVFGLIILSLGLSGAMGSGPKWIPAFMAPLPGATPKCQELVTCAFQQGASLGFMNENAWEKATAEERERTCHGLEMLDIDDMIKACRAGEGKQLGKGAR